MGLKTGDPVSVHTSHCTQVKSHLILLSPVMMDDKAPTHERRKLVKTSKTVLPQKWIVVAEVCGETNSKKEMIKRLSRKTATNVKKKKTYKGES